MKTAFRYRLCALCASFLFIGGLSFVGISVPAYKADQTAQIKKANGLQTAIFDTLHGRVIVHLPDDIRAGDTISGTVVTEPKGNTKDERARNTTVLNRYAVRIGDHNVPVPAPTFTWNVPFPPQRAEAGYKIVLVEVPNITPPTVPPVTRPTPDFTPYWLTVNSAMSSGKEGEPVEFFWFYQKAQIKDRTQPAAPVRYFHVPVIGQQGRPLEIFGPFDGDSSNTTLMFGPAGSALQDFEKSAENVSGGFGLIRPLAESPRKLVFESPSNVSGPISLMVKERDKIAVAAYRNVAVNLKSPKTNLMRGERTTLTTEVTGLAGIKEPVPLTLEAQGVITMEGGMFQQILIQPADVRGDTYTTTRSVTGQRSGGWSATSTVVTTGFNIVLRDPDPPQTILFNSFTGDYLFCGTGPKLSGTGKIQMKGCIITLTHDAPDRRVFGRLDACSPVDNGAYFPRYTPGTNTDIVVTVTDTKPTRTRVYFNPLGKPAPPVQDVSAFATCP